MNKRLTILLIISLLAVKSFAQAIVYNSYTYRPEIKSVECYNAEKEGSFPIINLRSNEQIQLNFDDLTGQSRNYYYTLQHCDAQWAPSNLSPAEYLQSFMEDRLLNYWYASGTVQKYVHYELKLPNQNIAPKLSGNYILKVYEDGDQRRLALTRRIYVVNTRAGINAEMVPSNNVALRPTNQKINFQVDYAGINVSNPYNDIKVLIMQNSRPETAVLNTRPTNVRGTQLLYNDYQSNDFAGGNEFRHFDIRSLKLNSERVARIFKDTANTVLLLGDASRRQSAYLFQYDNDGNFFIRNQDGRDARVDADYIQVYFGLNINLPATEGDVYITGKFNDYRLDASSKLQYDASRNIYTTNLLLKQGVYDYQYVWVPRNTNLASTTETEGSYFETENEYQLLVYYHAPGARWEELVGYRLLTNAQKR
ncbi:DUF5103 domain-containing protein [Mucilaginibacter sp. Bleaf8]|uniref:type IX secretion system plug protein n=1 Tax=Mucilaginibacter sp. Bleaf8 TaxID=2834430 RepID=UPI001BCBA3DF|nr:DUF5103 domain-containing protein [Mucilaginibacter sp. Bleaf8]MBS7563626.1 DUF5103 domain-containing protein [Mucilaginibacter sp. Bleaf8]